MRTHKIRGVVCGSVAVGAVLFLTLLAGCAATDVAKRRWTKVEVENFTLLSALGPKATTALAAELTSFPRIFTRVTNIELPAKSAARTQVFAFAHGLDASAFSADGDELAYFIRRVEGNYLAVADDEWAHEGWVWQPILHSMVHEMLDRAGRRYPPWYEEGLAMFLAAKVQRGSRIEIGWPPAVWQGSTRTEGDVSGMQTRSDISYQLNLDPLWLKVDYLLLGHLTHGGHPDLRPALARYLELYDSGLGEEQAAKTAFGDLYDGTWESFPMAWFSVKELSLPPIPQPVPVAPGEMATALGRLSMATDRPEQALELFRLAESEAPNSVEALAGEASALIALQDQRGAEELLLRALAKAPASAPAHTAYADLLIERSGSTADQKTAATLIAQARAHFLRAIKSDPDAPASYFKLGLTYLQEGSDPKLGIAALDRAMTRGQHPRVRLALAELYARAGDSKRARKEVDRLLRSPHLSIGEDQRFELARLAGR